MNNFQVFSAERFLKTKFLWRRCVQAIVITRLAFALSPPYKPHALGKSLKLKVIKGKCQEAFPKRRTLPYRIKPLQIDKTLLLA